MTMSRLSVNNVGITAVFAYPPESNTPTITTWKRMDIDAFEHSCKDSRIFQDPSDKAWKDFQNMFPVRAMDSLHGTNICKTQ